MRYLGDMDVQVTGTADGYYRFAKWNLGKRIIFKFFGSCFKQAV